MKLVEQKHHSSPEQQAGPRAKPGWQGTALSLAAILLALGLSWHFFVQPLRPWPDQGWVLQAAVRHARGDGLTTQMNSADDDLTALSYDRLVYFPPLYPLLVSALLRTGLTVDAAVQLINAVALVLGVIGWLILASRYRSSLLLRVLFAGLLVMAGTRWGSAMVPKGGTADYIFWAATPYWFLLVLAARAAPTPARLFGCLAGASVLTAVLIGVRWAAVVLIPAGGLALLWPDGRRVFLGRCLVAAFYALPAVGAYWAYGAVNRAYSQAGGNLLSFITPKWEFGRLATLYPFESLFAIPLGLDALLGRAYRAVDPGLALVPWGVLFRVALPLLLLAALLWAWRRRGADEPDRARDLRVVVGIQWLTVVLFLAYLAVRYSWGEGNDWSYLDEPRYFRPLWPAAALFWLSLVNERIMRIRLARTIAVGILLTSLIYLLQAHVRTEVRRLTVPDESWQLVERVRKLAAHPGLQVVCDTDVSDYIVSAGPNLLARGYPAVAQAPRLVVTRAADLWLVRRPNERTAYVSEPEFDARRFWALARRFGARRVWVSSNGNYELYHARLRPMPVGWKEWTRDVRHRRMALVGTGSARGGADPHGRHPGSPGPG
jgi:hypothetical protein